MDLSKTVTVADSFSVSQIEPLYMAVNKNRISHFRHLFITGPDNRSSYYKILLRLNKY